MQSLADELEAQLRLVATPERAEHEKRYLKSGLTFLGAPVGEIRAAVRDIARRLPPDHDRIVELVEALWSRGVHEQRMAAVVVLDRFAALLGVDDLPLLERLVRESRTWALVDGLAGDALGRLVERDPDAMRPAMDRWAGDADFWVRRASLLAELRSVRRGAPLDRFLRRAEPMLDEREFFIRKAIGCVLREAGKRRPEDVSAWLAPRTHRVSGVTIREAVKYLPVDVAAALISAYREGRPAT